MTEPQTQAAPPERRTGARRRIAAQLRIELLLTLRRGESVLLTFAIPVLLFGFFGTVDVFPMVEDPTTFLFAGVIALAVMSTSMVSLAIATGFERSTRVLKRLGASPLRRSELLTAKILSILAIEVLQLIVLSVEAVALGWESSGVQILPLVAVCLLGTVAFAGLGLLMAGRLPALTTLAAANGLYLVLLLFGGMIVPLSKFPGTLQGVARALPAGALSDACYGALSGSGVPIQAWIVLAIWAVVTPAVAAKLFRWE